jgi:2-polyprenyl-6-methoxyphenol hydroxylase-like FAD-dependent oxidoreductase
LAFAQALHRSELYHLIQDAERVADITAHRFPTSIWRHYERLTSFPEGLVMGDAISRFNPFYGQGMSSAALQVQVLQQALAARETGPVGFDGLARAHFLKAAEIIAMPWALAAGRHLACPHTTVRYRHQDGGIEGSPR